MRRKSCESADVNNDCHGKWRKCCCISDVSQCRANSSPVFTKMDLRFLSPSASVIPRSWTPGRLLCEWDICLAYRVPVITKISRDTLASRLLFGPTAGLHSLVDNSPMACLTNRPRYFWNSTVAFQGSVSSATIIPWNLVSPSDMFSRLHMRTTSN